MKKKPVEGYNAMPKKRGFLQQLWVSFSQLDKFSKMSIVTMLVIIFATPTIITTRLIIAQHAQDSTNFIATAGAKPFFSVNNLTDTQLPLSSATISWTTSSQSKGTLYYWEDNTLQNILSFFSLGKLTYSETDYTVAHSFTIPPEVLKANSNYNYQISAVDADGVQYVTKTYTFTVVFR